MSNKMNTDEMNKRFPVGNKLRKYSDNNES